MTLFDFLKLGRKLTKIMLTDHSKAVETEDSVAEESVPSDAHLSEEEVYAAAKKDKYSRESSP